MWIDYLLHHQEVHIERLTSGRGSMETWALFFLREEYTSFSERRMCTMEESKKVGKIILTVIVAVLSFGVWIAYRIWKRREES